MQIAAIGSSRKATMTITIERASVRVTGAGQKLLMIYGLDLGGMSFQMWEHGPITKAMIDKLSERDMVGVSIDIIGRLNVMVYKGYDGKRIRRNVFLIEGWQRADEKIDTDAKSDISRNQNSTNP
jgi:hypothetical protein